MADVFISYAREDQAVVRRLHERLVARGREPWVDWEGIEPSDKWLESIREAIDHADAVVFVLSTHSLASAVCRLELDHAVAQHKRLIPVVAGELGDNTVPDALAELNWIFARDGVDDIDGAVNALVRALETDIELVRTHTRVLTRARAWELSGRRTSPLLRGEELRQAEAWVARAAAGARPYPTELQAAFVAASRRTAGRRQRALLGGSLAVTAISVALAAFALISRSQAIQQRNLAVSNELTADSSRQLADDPQLSILLAREALYRSPTPAARLALVTALDASPVQAILHSSGPKFGVAYSRSGTLLAVAGQSGMLDLWQPRSHRLLRSIRASSRALGSLAMSANGTEVATGGVDGFVRIWNTTSGRLVRVLSGHRGSVDALGFSQDGRYLISGAADSTARVWDLTSGRTIHVIEGFKGSVRGVAIGPGNRFVVTADGLGGTTALWDTSSWRVIRSYRPPLHSQIPVDLALSPNGRLVATAGNDGNIRLWDFVANTKPRVLSGHINAVAGVAFSPNGKLLASGGFDDTGRLWNVATGKQLRVYTGHRGIVYSVAFSPDGLTLATAADDGTTRLWAVTSETRAVRRVLRPRKLGIAALAAIAVSPDSKDVVAAGPDGVVHAWVATTGREVWAAHAVGFGDTLRSLAFSPDGRFVLGGGEGGVVLLDARDGKVVRRLTSDGSNCAAFSADGASIAVDGGNSVPRVRIWDARSGALRRTLTAKPAYGELLCLAFSPDGKHLAAGSEGGVVRLWDVSSGKVERELRGPTAAVWDVAYTPDGSILAGAGGDKRGWIWDARTGAVIRELKGHTAAVFSLAISGDGTRVATASDDLTARIWDLRTGATIRVLTGHTDILFDVAFPPDGTYVATTGGDAVVRLWDSCGWCQSTSELLAHAEPEIVRCLTADERQTFLHETARKDEPCAA